MNQSCAMVLAPYDEQTSWMLSSKDQCELVMDKAPGDIDLLLKHFWPFPNVLVGCSPRFMRMVSFRTRFFANIQRQQWTGRAEAITADLIDASSERAAFGITLIDNARRILHGFVYKDDHLVIKPPRMGHCNTSSGNWFPDEGIDSSDGRWYREAT